MEDLNFTRGGLDIILNEVKKGEFFGADAIYLGFEKRRERME